MNSRETILNLLRDGRTVSGGDLSRRLGLSRSAIWKAVTALRNDGYDIEAAPGRGYRLRAAPDILSETEVRRFLGPVRVIGNGKPKPPTATANASPVRAARKVRSSSPTVRPPDADA